MMIFHWTEMSAGPDENRWRTYNSLEKPTNNAIYTGKLYMSDVLQHWSEPNLWKIKDEIDIR